MSMTNNSVQTRDGRLDSGSRPRTSGQTTGATFGPKTVFRPTTMSLAMAAAGLIPAGHLVGTAARTGLLRHRGDFTNLRRSVVVNL